MYAVFSRKDREQAEWEGGIAVKHVWAEGSGQNVIQDYRLFSVLRILVGDTVHCTV